MGGNGDEKNKSAIDSGATNFIKSLITNFFGFSLPSVKLDVKDSKEEAYPKTSDCKVCGGSGKSPSTMDGNFPKDNRKDKIGQMYVDSAKDFYEAENALGNGGNGPKIFLHDAWTEFKVIPKKFYIGKRHSLYHRKLIFRQLQPIF